MKRARRRGSRIGPARLAMRLRKSARSGRYVTTLRSTSRIGAFPEENAPQPRGDAVEGEGARTEHRVIRLERSTARLLRAQRRLRTRRVGRQHREVGAEELAPELAREELLHRRALGFDGRARIDSVAAVKGFDGLAHGLGRGDAFR